MDSSMAGGSQRKLAFILMINWHVGAENSWPPVSDVSTALTVCDSVLWILCLEAAALL